jgi:Family of unknown function (DUF5995)
VAASTSLEVSLARLDRIIEVACTEGSHLGVFPAMYRSVTAAVRDAVRTGGFFDDDERVEHLTVVFADLYFDAYDRHRGHDEAPRCWAVAFDTALAPSRRMILQHLLLGMNAHINLDLGLATVAAAGDDLPGIQGDFVRVNEILFQILDDLQGGLGAVSPRMSWLDRLGGTWDERMMRLGIRTCRDMAWSFAERLATVDDGDGAKALRDDDAAWLARSMLRPLSPVNLVGRFVARAESRDIRKIVAALDHGRVDFEAAQSAASVDMARLAAGGSHPTGTLHQAARHRRLRR